MTFTRVSHQPSVKKEENSSGSESDDFQIKNNSLPREHCCVLI